MLYDAAGRSGLGQKAPAKFLIQLLLRGVSLTPALALMTTAHAQTPDGAKGAELEEVIVTATKRSESIQEVPIAVSAFSGEQLAASRIMSLSDLAASVPGPTFVPISGGSGSQMQIRGQYASDDAPAFDTPVGVFIDDIYYGSVASFYPDFYDIEQIAVLRGPQGTTFGRNTVGGALQVISARPSVADGLSGKVSLTVRNPTGVESEGHVNTPLSDTAALRVAYSIKDYDGFRQNVTTGNDLNDKRAKSGRASLLLQPSDSLDVLASVSYTKEDSLGDGPLLIGQGGLIASLDAQRTDDDQTFVDDDGRNEREIMNSFVRLDWETGIGTLTSITGYRSLEGFYREDIDGSPVPIAPNKIDINDEEQVSQEFRLTSESGGQLEWIAGLYYLDQSIFRSETYTFGGLAPWRVNGLTGGTLNQVLISGDIGTESIAPFGEATWHFTDRWALTAGARYTYDKKENRTRQQNLTTPGASTIFFGLPKDVTADESWDAWTPRVVLEYQPGDDVFLYANASRGFKSGGYNYAAPTVAQAQTPLLPEESMSYEIGVKSYTFDRRLKANLAVYHTTTEDLQVRSLVGTALQSNNAGEARVRGAELELEVQPLENFAIGGNFAYTDAEYTSYRGCAAGGIDCTGNRIPFTPLHSTNAWTQYRWGLANDSSLTFRAEGKWASNYQLHPQSILVARNMTAQRDIVNAFLTYEAPAGRWSVRAWSRNLLDKQYVAFATNYFFYLLTQTEATTGGLTEADRATVNEARSYGVTLNYRFD